MRKKFKDALRTVKRIAFNKQVAPEKKYDFFVPKTKRDLQELHDIIKKEQYVATDGEFNHLIPFNAKSPPEFGVVGFSWDNKAAGCIPLQRRTGLQGCKFHWREGVEAARAIWAMKKRWLAHNGKTDMLWGRYYKMWLGGREHPTGLYVDTMLASYALDSRKGFHDLKQWGVRVGMADYERPLKQYKILHPEADPDKGGNLLLVPSDILYPYNMMDCIATRRVFFKQKPMLKERNLWHKPLMYPLMWHQYTAFEMEWAGVEIDPERNIELDTEFSSKIQKLDIQLRERGEVVELQKKYDDEKFEEVFNRVQSYKRPIPNPKKRVIELFEKQREPINLNSPDVKRELLFDICKLQPISKTESGQYSTNADDLHEILKDEPHPVLKKILRRSEYSSIHSKYIKPVPMWIGTDGRTHTVYKIHGTVTGRPSSENPNHLNLPARSEFTKKIMSQFIARKGFVLLKRDSKQIELRLIADRAQDETMIQEFRDGKDPHAMGAQAAYSLTEERWALLSDAKRKKLRSFAKNAVSFGLVYGREARALARDFGWRLSKAIGFKTRYFAKYKGIAKYLEDAKDEILEKLYSISNYGRVRDCSNANSDDEYKQGEAIREGINAPIQGDASDINFIAANRLARWLHRHKMRSKVIIFVYDAVWVEAAIDEMQVVSDKLHYFMTDRKFIRKTTGWKLGVPLDTDCALGYNGGSLVEMKTRQMVLPEAA